MHKFIVGSLLALLVATLFFYSTATVRVALTLLLVGATLTLLHNLEWQPRLWRR